MPTRAILPPEFLTGANLPWLHYGIDFGANAWRPEGGIAQPAERKQLETVFQSLADDGVQAVRWFLFCDGRAGIRFSDRGSPEGLDTHVFRDVEAALAIAAPRRIRLVFVLIDFLWCDTTRIVKGVQLGGRSSILQEPDARDQLLANVFRPLLSRYGQDPGILAWDVINEPEWIRTVDRIELDAFLRETIWLVRSETRHLVTVGSAGVRWRDRYRDLALDFYQVHWYDALSDQPALATRVDRLGFDKPVMLGEFPTRGSRLDRDEIIRIAIAAGYRGAFYWSELGTDECSAVDRNSSKVV